MTGQEIKEHIGENKGSTYSGLLLGEISLDPTMCVVVRVWLTLTEPGVGDSSVDYYGQTFVEQ